MTCVNLRLGYNNQIPDAVLAASPSPETPLDYIKNEHRARLSIWPQTASNGNIDITGTLATPRYAQFFSIPGVDRVGDVEVKLSLFLSPNNALDLLNMPFTPARRLEPNSQIPLGTWIAGVDEYGGSDTSVVPQTFIHWFDNRVYYDSFKLTIRRASFSSAVLKDVRMRMLYIGDMLELERNFSNGHSIKFTNPPELKQTASGAWRRSRRQVKSRKMIIDVNRLSDNDFDRLQQLEQELAGGPMIISAFPGSEKRLLYDNYNMLGIFGNELEFAQRFTDAHRSEFTFLEA